jgi:hypothetical protein
VTFWIQYPTIRGPLQAVGSMLVFAAMAVPTWISAVRRRCPTPPTSHRVVPFRPFPGRYRGGRTGGR